MTRNGRPDAGAPADFDRRYQPAHRLITTVEIAALLRAERAARGLSQAETAARIGVSRQTWIGLETGVEGAAAPAGC